jgi:hypothetical protein
MDGDEEAERGVFALQRGTRALDGGGLGFVRRGGP